MSKPNINELYEDLGKSIAAVLAHSDCPAEVHNSLTDFMDRFNPSLNSGFQIKGAGLDALHAEKMLPCLLALAAPSVQVAAAAAGA